MIVAEGIGRLRRLARRWGGDVVELGQWDGFPQGVAPAPFTAWLAIDYEMKLVYVRSPCNEATVGEAIHEMGHIFASTVGPYASKEYDFFGWEYAVARQLRLVRVWCEGAFDYSVPSDDDGRWPNTEFGRLRPDQREALLQERLQAARAKGLLTRCGKAVAIR